MSVSRLFFALCGLSAAPAQQATQAVANVATARPCLPTRAFVFTAFALAVALALVLRRARRRARRSGAPTFAFAAVAKATGLIVIVEFVHLFFLRFTDVRSGASYTIILCNERKRGAWRKTAYKSTNRNFENLYSDKVRIFFRKEANAGYALFCTSFFVQNCFPYDFDKFRIGKIEFLRRIRSKRPYPFAGSVKTDKS